MTISRTGNQSSIVTLSEIKAPVKGTECYICLEEEAPFVTHPGGTGHQFHPLCIDQWIEQSAKLLNPNSTALVANGKADCPCCKYTILHWSVGTAIEVERVSNAANVRNFGSYGQIAEQIPLNTGEPSFTRMRNEDFAALNDVIQTLRVLRGFTGTMNNVQDGSFQRARAEYAIRRNNLQGPYLVDEVHNLLDVHQEIYYSSGNTTVETQTQTEVQREVVIAQELLERANEDIYD